MPIQNDDVINFINSRFPNSQSSDADWLHGNCYYFALILADRFKNKSPEIYYDVVYGHFLTLIDKNLYDASGVAYKLSEEEFLRIQSTQLWSPIVLNFDITIVNWRYFDKYDSIQYERVCRDCLE